MRILLIGGAGFLGRHLCSNFLAQARAHIEVGDYAGWSRAWIERYEAGEAGG